MPSAPRSSERHPTSRFAAFLLGRRRPAVNKVSWCPFCRRIERRRELIAVRESAVAFEDLHPLNPGHCLVVPIRHEPDFFELTSDEQDDIWELVWELRELLVVEHEAKAFNVGVNAGRAAGQTVGMRTST